MTSATTSAPAFEIRELGPRHVASVRETIRQEQIPEAMGRIFGLVAAATAKQGITPSELAFARYHSFGGSIDVEAGFSVPVPIQPDGEVRPGQLPEGPAAVALHVGPYDTLADTYAALEGWLQEQGREADGAMWECYLTDPESEPDPQRWRTEVYVPLATE